MAADPDLIGRRRTRITFPADVVRHDPFLRWPVTAVCSIYGKDAVLQGLDGDTKVLFAVLLWAAFTLEGRKAAC